MGVYLIKYATKMRCVGVLETGVHMQLLSSDDVYVRQPRFLRECQHKAVGELCHVVGNMTTCDLRWIQNHDHYRFVEQSNWINF